MKSKLRAVVRHEYLTIIRQPSFWISLIIFPLIAGIILLVGALTGESEKDLTKNKSDNPIVIIDESGLLNPSVAKTYNLELRTTGNVAELEKSVQNGTIDGLVVYPKNLEETGTYQIFANNSESSLSGPLTDLAKVALQQSLLSELPSEKLAGLALSGGEGTVKVYRDGNPQRELAEYIVPAAFLVLFYIVLIYSVGYALTSVSEEKENRSIEMVLSYVKSRTLIMGKLLAIVLVTFTQIICIALIAAVALGIAKSMGNSISLPFNVSDLSFIPTEIMIGIGFLIVGFIFYVALMAMVGAIFPSSKEASGFSTVFFILPAVPFWGADALANDPSGGFSQFLTFFPPTAPVAALLRNAMGNLGALEGLLSLLALALATISVIYLAAKAFRLGTLEYTNRIKLTALLRK